MNSWQRWEHCEGPVPYLVVGPGVVLLVVGASVVLVVVGDGVLLEVVGACEELEVFLETTPCNTSLRVRA